MWRVDEPGDLADASALTCPPLLLGAVELRDVDQGGHCAVQRTFEGNIEYKQSAQKLGFSVEGRIGRFLWIRPQIPCHAGAL